ncbi:hypothetical protein [Marinoscillum pacificum]|uniref:hypothetical protein n=1 Tax=Marinoscillum pacificum TaxID=392723 RepID=UPI0021582190|nr:hypothetical protein [Marinoscillum pacificum]
MLVIYACSEQINSDDISPQDYEKITLRSFSNSFEMSDSEVIEGLKWSLSFLGATLPKDSIGIHYVGNNKISVDLTKLGFTDNALASMKTIIKEIKTCESYIQNEYIDIGRFIVLTLNSSHHYYEITGVAKSLTEFRSKHQFDQEVFVINSSISKVDRIIEIAHYNNPNQIAYLCSEGMGSIAEGSFKVEEYETVEIMDNGQFRFALYDLDGRLKTAANSSLTNAGKPAKCLWCHETVVQPFFSADPVLNTESTLTKDEFSQIINEQMGMLSDYRKTLHSHIDFESKQNHSFAEFLYIDFMEPTIDRLMEEWSMTESEVNELVQGLPTYSQTESGHMGVFKRSDVDNVLLKEVLRVPDEAREYSSYEPNFFN